MNDTFTISDFIILTTGSDGGHRYIETHITYQEQLRCMTVFFRSKLDEVALQEGKSFKVTGTLMDDGQQYRLILRDSILVEE